MLNVLLCLVSTDRLVPQMKSNTKVNTKAQGHNFLEFRNLKNFNAAKFLDDLHDVLWEDIRYKRNIDDMWKLWKTYFLGSLISMPLRE